MPYYVTFPLEGLGDRAYARTSLVLLCATLASLGLDYLHANPHAPSLAAAPVLLTSARSKLDKPGQEWWSDIPTSLERGRLDPPSAVAWRVAELTDQGHDVEPDIVDDGWRYRFVVRYADGRFEDPAPDASAPFLDRMRVTFCMDLFDGKRTQDLSHKALRTMLRTLTMIDVLYLTLHPDTTPLYDSGVFYREEPPGAEDWQDIPTSLRRGRGDCDDVGPWRAAEHIVRGTPASADFRMQKLPNGGTLYHIITKTPYGDEDPSMKQGMR